jgi:5'-nucleotidase
VLLSNDDGVTASGLRALRDRLLEWAQVVICAPETNQSATSHSLTLHRPLRLRRVAENEFALDGTPADCVYVALFGGSGLLPRRPDVVVSGLNHGLNLGADVFYSGTVAAAREGALRGVPALAASADRDADQDRAAALAAQVARRLASLGEAGRGLFNLNVPALPPGRSAWELRGTRLGARLYSDDVSFRENPRGEPYLWIGGAPLRHDHVAGSDTDAHDHGVASLSALSLDLTAPSLPPVALLDG